MYYTYILRCKDNSLYTGITNDLEKRMKAHFSGSKVAAKYTKSHEPLKVEIVWKSKDKVLASKLEYHIKKLTKQQKEKIILGDRLKNYLKGKIDCRRYTRIKY